MNLLKKTKDLCLAYGIKPSRSKGQNFLVNEKVYDQIVTTAGLKLDDIVLEVGPGLGFLTSRLAKIVKKVIAVELDDRLAEVLETGLFSQGIKNVEVVNEDILKFSIFPADEAPLRGGNFQFSNNFKIQNTKFKIVANIPYNISSIFLRKFLSAEVKPSMMVLLLQQEVAERICAHPGKMSLLAVSVQFYAKPEIIEVVPANAFWPEPAVGSAIVKLKVKNGNPFFIPNPFDFAQGRLREESLKGSTSEKGSLVADASRDDNNEREFFRLVKIGFSARRKMLKNNLAAGFLIDQKIIAERIKNAGLSENCRPQELSVDDWVRLSGYFK